MGKRWQQKNLEKEMQMVLKHRIRCSILHIENKCKLKSTLLVKKKVKVTQSYPTLWKSPNTGQYTHHYLANTSAVMAGTRRNKQVQVQFSSVAQLCPTLWDPMNRSMPGLPVHHQLPDSTQTHAHRVGDAIQSSHPLLSPSAPVPNPSQH